MNFKRHCGPALESSTVGDHQLSRQEGALFESDLTGQRPQAARTDRSGKSSPQPARYQKQLLGEACFN